MDIELSPFTKSDFDRLINWVSDENLLVTIAGLDFKYPLDVIQLSEYIKLPDSWIFNVVLNQQIIGHGQIVQSGDQKCKLDKLLIGDKSLRGQGIGEKLVRELMKFAFTKLTMHEVELNVYDWNIAGIKCYEKVGFLINPGIALTTKRGKVYWKALNMSITKKKWATQTSNR